MKKVNAILIIIFSTMLLVANVYPLTTFLFEIDKELLYFRFLSDAMGFILSLCMLIAGILLLTRKEQAFVYALSVLFCAAAIILLFYSDETYSSLFMLCGMILAPIIVINSLLILFNEMVQKKTTVITQ